MMSTRLPRRLNETEERYLYPKILSIIGISEGEPAMFEKYAWNYQGSRRHKPPKISGKEWKKVFHVPPKTLNLGTNILNGTKVYGDPENNDEAWQIQFNETEFSKYKIEYGDKIYVLRYDKDGENNKTIKEV